MKARRIQVVVCEVGMKPIPLDMPDTLEAFQEAVGGYLEGYQVPERPGFMVYCYEMGRYECKANRVVPGLDMIHGTFVIVKTGEDGENASMTNKEALDIIRYFQRGN